VCTLGVKSKIRAGFRHVGSDHSLVSSQEFLATDPEIPGSIPSATIFSEK
jgi:hypothetical protein